MVPPWGRGSSSRGRIHGRNALSGGSGGHGGGDSGGLNCSGGGGGGRAWIGAVSRGRRRAAHPRPVAVSSMGLRHGWAREGEEVERNTSKPGNENLKRK